MRRAALLALTAVLFGCSTAVPAPLKSQAQSLASDQTLRVRLPQAPRSLDPALAQDSRETAVIRQFSEPLLKPAPDGRDVQPAAAESFEVSADGLTWTFHLRANGRYADGQPVRAADFVYAWRRLIDPRTAAPHADYFAAVVKGGQAAESLDPKADAGRLQAALDGLGLKALDDLTFQVTSGQASGQLRWVAAMPEGGPLRPDMTPASGTDGNGPFRVSENAPDHTTLIPNPNYWAGRTTLNKIELEYTADAATALAAYQRGDLELDAAPPDGLDSRLQKQLLKTPELTTFWVDFNTERPPLDNAKVRAAFAEALDRQSIASQIFGGRAVPATTLIPQGMPGYHPEDGKPQEMNLAAARQLLDQSGVARDQLIALPLIVRDRAFDRDFANAIAGQLGRDLGVSIAVQIVSLADYAKRLRAGDFALAGPTGWTADYPDPQDFYDLFRSNDGNNAARWRNPRYDDLVKLADTEVAPDKRDQLYNQAAQLLEQDSPVAFVVQRYDWTLVQPYVKGVRPVAVDEWPGATYSPLIYIATH